MARPTNAGLDYFPLDTDIDQDDKIALVESDFGVEGFGIIIKLLMKIYSTGYFYEWGEMEQKLFVRRVNVDINTLSAVVNACIRWGVFNKEIYETFNVLTSRGIQKRYLEATSRRKDVEVFKEYLLLNKNEISRFSNLVIVNIEPNSTGVNVDINPNSTDSMLTETPQSKVKERKVEESRVKNSNKETDDDINAQRFYQQNFGVASAHIIQDLQLWVEDLSDEVVVLALTKAVEKNAPYSYAKAIMKNWASKDIKTVEDAEAESLSNAKQKNTFNKPTNRKENLPDWAKERADSMSEGQEDEPISAEEQAAFMEKLKRIRARKAQESEEAANEQIH